MQGLLEDLGDGGKKEKGSWGPIKAGGRAAWGTGAPWVGGKGAWGFSED